MVGTGVVGPAYGLPTRRKSNNATPQQAYSSSIMQTGQDYDSIMGGYKDILSNPDDGQLAGLMTNYRNLLSQNPSQYSQSSDVATSLGNLKELSETGGYSEGDIGALRARASSPIRAVYANMMRDMERQRAIGGGYSPNFNAASSRMARESSEQIAGANTDVNARIAEMIASGKKVMAPQYASSALAESGLKHNVENANRLRQMALLDSMKGLTDTKNATKMGALQGMTSMYGTTPALASTFGNQVLNMENQNLQNKSLNQNANIALMNSYLRTPRIG